jgi:hypothetical protein
MVRWLSIALLPLVLVYQLEKWPCRCPIRESVTNFVCRLWVTTTAAWRQRNQCSTEALALAVVPASQLQVQFIGTSVDCRNGQTSQETPSQPPIYVDCCVIQQRPWRLTLSMDRPLSVLLFTSRIYARLKPLEVLSTCRVNDIVPSSPRLTVLRHVPATTAGGNTAKAGMGLFLTTEAGEGAGGVGISSAPGSGNRSGKSA